MLNGTYIQTTPENPPSSVSRKRGRPKKLNYSLNGDATDNECDETQTKKARRCLQ